jgi:hypothetical protein
MPDRTTAGRDRWEYCPNSGTGQRNKYTGTLGRSGLAGAGTATQGPDERIHMRRLTWHVSGPHAYAYAYAHIHAYAHVTPHKRARGRMCTQIQAATRAAGDASSSAVRRSHYGTTGFGSSAHVPSTTGLPATAPAIPYAHASRMRAHAARQERVARWQLATGAAAAQAFGRVASASACTVTLPARCLPGTSTRIRPRIRPRHRHCSTMRRVWSASTVAASTARRVVSRSLAHKHLGWMQELLRVARWALQPLPEPRLSSRLCYGYGAQRAATGLVVQLACQRERAPRRH